MDRIDDMSLEGLVHSEKMVLGCYIDNKKSPTLGLFLNYQRNPHWIGSMMLVINSYFPIILKLWHL